MPDQTNPIPSSGTSPKCVWPKVAVPGQGYYPGSENDPNTGKSDNSDRPVKEPVTETRSLTGVERQTGQWSPDSGHSDGQPGHSGSGNTTPVVGDRAVPTGAGGHNDPVDVVRSAPAEGAQLLDELRAEIGRYVVLPSPEALSAVALWVAATHIQPVLQHAPRLAVVGPTKKCGKSRLLDVLTETVHKPLITVNTSPAVVYRVIGQNPPTLLVDEADTIFGTAKVAEKNEELRGLLNAGHQRNRPVWRISGPEHKPAQFPTFAMAALAGIGSLPDTIMDRAIVIRMQRRRSGETVAPFRSTTALPDLHALRDRLTSWLGRQLEEAAFLTPPMPVEDRAADTWEPLVMVADLAGGDWPRRARSACQAMAGHEADQDEETTLKTRLLRDIRCIFEEAGTPEALRTRDLLAGLCQDAEAPWADYGTNGLNAHHLGNLLREFGITSANVRFADGSQAKGFAHRAFADAWLRYCPDVATAEDGNATTTSGEREPAC